MNSFDRASRVPEPKPAIGALAKRPTGCGPIAGWNPPAPGPGVRSASRSVMKRAPLLKPYDGALALRPSGCVPPIEGGMSYFAGPGECIPAVASAVCSCETKTLFATSLVAAPKPNEGAVRRLLLFCPPKVDDRFMSIDLPSNGGGSFPPPPMVAAPVGLRSTRGNTRQQTSGCYCGGHAPAID